VVAPNWLGDVVMGSALLDVLAGARGPAGEPVEIVLAIRRRWAPLFARDPRVAAVLPVERTGRHRGLTGIWRLGRDWRRSRCRGVVLGPPSLRVALAARLAALPERVGRRSDGRGFLLNRGLPVLPRGERHHADELADLGRELLAAVGADAAPEPAAARPLPGCAATPARTTAGPGLWVFAPDATYGEAKVWPSRHAAAFLRAAVLDEGRRVALLGDAAATAAAVRLAAAAGLPRRTDLAGEAGLVDLTGRTDVAEAVAVLKAAEGFVGSDSGLMHLAAALEVPTVGVFGSSNPDWTGPRGPWTAVVAAEGFPCRPCYLRRCDQPVFCLEEVPATRVLAALKGLLELRDAEKE
jgi:heptosyltransferase-2